MTVKEYLEKNCNIEELKEISYYNDFWYSSYRFFLQNRNKLVAELSPKQKAWLHRITRGLMDRSIN